MPSLITDVLDVALEGAAWWKLALAAVVVYKIVEYVVWVMRTKSVDGQVVLVTGGGSGIGRLMALNFASKGAIVVLVDINEAGLVSVVDEIDALDGVAHAFKCDVTDREQVYELAEEIVADVGDVDILINNAGIVSGKSILDVSDAMAELTINVNAVSHIWFIKAFLPAMKARNSGSIVSIASAAGLSGVAGLVDYCASKFAAVGLMEALRMELAREGSNVHTLTVMPFYIATGMFEGARGIPLVLPILQPDYVANRIVTAIQRSELQLFLPPILGYLVILRGLFPTSFVDSLSHWIGISSSMDEFCGRGQDWHENKKQA